MGGINCHWQFQKFYSRLVFAFLLGMLGWGGQEEELMDYRGLPLFFEAASVCVWLVLYALWSCTSYFLLLYFYPVVESI